MYLEAVWVSYNNQTIQLCKLLFKYLYNQCLLFTVSILQFKKNNINLHYALWVVNSTTLNMLTTRQTNCLLHNVVHCLDQLIECIYALLAHMYYFHTHTKSMCWIQVETFSLL